jgi:1-deoxy-D-xylulose-5-phosphate synthase
MTAGMALEAMNHAGHMTTQKLIVILNDNAMSISPNVGALSRNVNKLRVDPLYRTAKRDLGEFVEHLPLGKQMWKGAKRVKASMRDLLVPVSFWEQFGFEYYGPIDGHNIQELETTLDAIKRVPGKPVLLHILTEKGHGVPEAAADPIKSHSGTYWLKKPAAADAPKPKPTYSQVFAQATQELIVRRGHRGTARRNVRRRPCHAGREADLRDLLDFPPAGLRFGCARCGSAKPAGGVRDGPGRFRRG